MAVIEVATLCDKANEYYVSEVRQHSIEHLPT
jgi:hypothetical protein